MAADVSSTPSRSPVTATAGHGASVRAAAGRGREGVTDLALSSYAVARTLADEYGVDDARTALRVAHLTSGWPGLVHLAGAALRGQADPDPTRALTDPGAAAAHWIRSSMLTALPAGAAELLRAVTEIDPTAPVTPAVCDAAADACGRDRIPHLVPGMRRAGMLVPRRHPTRFSELTLVPVVALVLRAEVDGPPPSRRTAEVARAVARVHEREQAWLPAATAHAVAGDRARVVQLLERHGADMLRHGDAADVVQLVERVVGERLHDESERLQQTCADAARLTGDLAHAWQAFAPLVSRAEVHGWRPGLAARVAGLHHQCGELGTALDVLDRCPVDSGPSAGPPASEDVVDWLACRVHVLAGLGRVDDATSAAASCLRTAEHLGDARALGVAHLAVARTCRGTLEELHHGRAVRYATAAGDAVTVAGALAAQAHRLLVAARPDRAVVTGREAALLVGAGFPRELRATVLQDLAEALTRTGRSDEGRWHLECSAALGGTLGSLGSPDPCRVGEGYVLSR